MSCLKKKITENNTRDIRNMHRGLIRLIICGKLGSVFGVTVF